MRDERLLNHYRNWGSRQETVACWRPCRSSSELRLW